MKLRKQPRRKRSYEVVTWYIAKLGDPVWVRIGVGWCAGIIVGSKRQYALVKYLTGAKEMVAWSAMRFRRSEVQPDA
jgi:hypothetical protein